MFLPLLCFYNPLMHKTPEIYSSMILTRTQNPEVITLPASSALRDISHVTSAKIAQQIALIFFSSLFFNSFYCFTALDMFFQRTPNWSFAAGNIHINCFVFHYFAFASSTIIGGASWETTIFTIFASHTIRCLIFISFPFAVFLSNMNQPFLMRHPMSLTQTFEYKKSQP